MSGPFTIAIVLAALAGILLRPFGVREAVFAMAGAALLAATGLLPLGTAWRAAASGWDVYLFLTGMMLLAELAAVEGVFAWGAALVARAAGGAPMRLFALVYGMAVLVTVFLSNDATAVVFTPAVAAMAEAMQAPRKMPYLLICAFVANAASFVLPISNPANLVVFARAMPDLPHWAHLFLLPSAAAIAATFLLLWLMQRRELTGQLAVPAPVKLTFSGRLTLAGLAIMAALLLLASGRGWHLGPPCLAAGLGTAILVLAFTRQSPRPLLTGISWSVLPLVAGLFMMLGALDHIGLATALAAPAAARGIWQLGAALALLCNLVNNLPAGLLAGHVLATAPLHAKAAALIAIDLGPNLSVTGSLATLLWLNALRKHNEIISAGQFLRLGIIIMPPALVAALYALQLLS